MNAKLVEDETTIFEVDEDCLREKRELEFSENTMEIDGRPVNMQSCKRKRHCSSLWIILLLLCFSK